MLPLEGDRKPQLLIGGPSSKQRASFSPDGRWIAYSSYESARPEIYVQPFPTTGAKYQITTTGGTSPVWSPDGQQLFYLQQVQPPLGRLMSVDVRIQAGFAYANSTALFDQVLLVPLGPSVGSWPYDIAPDGKRFVVVTPAANVSSEKTPNPEIRVTLNWFEELKQRVPR